MEEHPSKTTPSDPAEPVSVDELLKGTGEAGEAPGGSAADLARAASILESLLLVSAEPLPFEKIRQLLGGISREESRAVVRILQEKYPADSYGILVE